MGASPRFHGLIVLGLCAAGLSLSACNVSVPLPGGVVAGADGAVSDPGQPDPVRDAASSDGPRARENRSPDAADPAACDPGTVLDWQESWAPRPQVFFAIDRSISMASQQLGGVSRRDAVRDALLPAMRSYQGNMNFGYAEFPARGSCNFNRSCCASVGVLPSRMRADAIAGQMQCTTGDSSCFESTDQSPTGDALGEIGFKLSRLVYNDKRFVIVITDGPPSCAADSDPCHTAIREASDLNGRDIITIIVGIGDNAKPGSSCLDDIARTGQGLGPTATPLFPWVADAASLGPAIQQALMPAVARTCRVKFNTSCSRWLDDVAVTFDSGSTIVPKDKIQGWEALAPDPQGRAIVRLNGSYCDDFRSGKLGDPDISLDSRICGGRPVCN
jgi:hypothetical protein